VVEYALACAEGRVFGCGIGGAFCQALAAFVPTYEAAAPGYDMIPLLGGGGGGGFLFDSCDVSVGLKVVVWSGCDKR
jgi:hypothetical protein